MRAAAAALALLALLAPSGALADGPGWGLPVDASAHGWRVDWLMNTTTVFVAILFAVTCGWIVVACVRHGRGHAAEYDRGSARSSVVKAAALSTVIFAVVDGNLLINGLTDLGQAFWNFDAAEAHPKAVRIQVNGHQWAWDIRYPGPDGKFNTADDIVTLNDMRVPVDVPVVVQLAATDVIHSFALPNFRVKQDAVPGMITRLWFQAKQTGEFDIACMQHCGVHHYKMRGQLTVMTEKDYQAWHDNASALSRAAFDPEDKAAQWGWEWERGIR